MNDDLNIALFFEKMAELINADVPLIRAIEIAAYELTDTQLQKRFLDMISSLEKGQSITDTFRGHPDLFPDFHLSIIDIGESSGHLERSLIQVANLLRKKNDNQSGESRTTSDLREPSVHPLSSPVNHEEIVKQLAGIKAQMAGLNSRLDDLISLLATRQSSSGKSAKK